MTIDYAKPSMPRWNVYGTDRATGEQRHVEVEALNENAAAAAAKDLQVRRVKRIPEPRQPKESPSPPPPSPRYQPTTFRAVVGVLFVVIGVGLILSASGPGADVRGVGGVLVIGQGVGLATSLKRA